MSDQFGMTLRITHAPNWEAPTALASRIDDILDGGVGIDEQLEELAEDYFHGVNVPDNATFELVDQASSVDALLAGAREVIDAAIAGESKFARCVTNPDGSRIIICDPNTGADEAVEQAWNTGLLAVAGFEI